MAVTEGKWQVTIDAKNNSSTAAQFIDTGIEVAIGYLLIINVDPQQTWTPYASYPQSTVDANGISVLTKKIDGIYKEEPGARSQEVNFQFPFGSLVGTVDGGRTYFPVGTHLEMTLLYQVTTPKLTLLFWGGDKNTNSGSITVNVELRKALNFDDKIDPKFLDADYFDVHAQIHSPGTKNFLDTGIKLQLGDLLIVNLDPKDLWNLSNTDSNWNLNANGVRASNKTLVDPTSNGNFPSFVLARGSLIGTLDGGQTLFPVGTHLEMTVLNPGSLSLMLWDDNNNNDNRGSLRAFIKVVRRAIPVAA